MRHALGTYRRLLGALVRSQMQYRTSFALDAISTLMISFLETGALLLVLQRFGSLGGWTLGEVAFIYGLVELSFGLMDMLFGGFDPARFGQEVRRGTFDNLLLRPVNVTVQVFGLDFALRRIGKIGFGLAVLAFAFVNIEMVWTVEKSLYLPLVVLGMVLFFGGMFVIGSTFTFWTVESVEVMNILTYGGSYLMSHPMHIYGDGLRRIFTYIVPAIFLNYYPALYFLDKPDPFAFPQWVQFISPLVGAGVFALAMAVWRFGIEHYSSTGS